MRHFEKMTLAMMQLAMCTGIMSSCSDELKNGETNRDYDLNVKVLQTRHCHALLQLYRQEKSFPDPNTDKRSITNYN